MRTRTGSVRARSAEIDSRTQHAAGEADRAHDLAACNTQRHRHDRPDPYRIARGLFRIASGRRCSCRRRAGLSAGFVGGRHRPGRDRRRHCHDGRTCPWDRPDRRRKRICVVRPGSGHSAGPRDDGRHVCAGSKPVRPHGHLRKCTGDRRLLLVHHFCRRHADLVVQPPDGGGSGHRQSAGPGDRGVWWSLDPCPAFAGTDLWRLWLSRARSLGRRRRDARVLRVGNAGLRSLSAGAGWRPQAVISFAKAFAGRRSPFSVSAECRPSSRPPPI